jgi:predicted TIM-barrel enzyme
VREDIIVLCHGGPISMPEDAEYVLNNCDRCHGFYGASSAERLPAEIAIRDQIKTFKSIAFKS